MATNHDVKTKKTGLIAIIFSFLYFSLPYFSWVIFFLNFFLSVFSYYLLRVPILLFINFLVSFNFLPSLSFFSPSHFLFLSLIPSTLPSLCSFPFFPPFDSYHLFTRWCWESSFRLVTSLRGGQLRNLDSILVRGQISLLQNLWSSSRSHAVWHSVGREDPPLTSSTLHIVPRLRMRGSISPFPIRFNSVHRDTFIIRSFFFIPFCLPFSFYLSICPVF